MPEDYNFAPSRKLAAVQGIAKGLQDWIKQRKQAELNRELRKAELYDRLQIIQAQQAGQERLQAGQLAYQREALEQTGVLQRLGLAQRAEQFEETMGFRREQLDYQRLADIADRRFELIKQEKQNAFIRSVNEANRAAQEAQFKANWENKFKLAGIEAENARDMAEFTWSKRAEIADLDRQMDMAIATLRSTGAEAGMTDAQKQYLAFSKQAISSLLSTLPMVAFAGAQSGMSGEEIANSLNQVYDLINVFTAGSNQIFQEFDAPRLPTPTVGVEEAGRKIFSIPPFKKQTRPVLQIPRQAPTTTPEETQTMEMQGEVQGPPLPLSPTIEQWVRQISAYGGTTLSENDKELLRKEGLTEEEINAIEAEIRNRANTGR